MERLLIQRRLVYTTSANFTYGSQQFQNENADFHTALKGQTWISK